MTDHFTQALVCAGVDERRVVRAPVSRLVVDVERFPRDADEPMAARGMGVVYRATSSLRPLRRALSPAEREALLCAWYHPHHARLEQAVAPVLRTTALVRDSVGLTSAARERNKIEVVADEQRAEGGRGVQSACDVAGDENFGEFVALILGVQIRSADTATVHVEHQLSGGRSRRGHIDDRQYSIRAADSLHSRGV
jgi:hypothetical protein